MSELCFNLWYYLDKQQTVSGIAVRAYLLEGTNDEMGQMLMTLSAHDYGVLNPSPPPQGRGMHFSELSRLGVEAVFEKEFKRIHESLPSTLPYPEEKFFLATPLYDFGDGFVPAEIGNGFIRERR